MKATPTNRPLSLVAHVEASTARITNHQTRPSRGMVYEVEPFSAFESGMFAACLAIEQAAFETDSKTAQLSTLLRAEYGEAGPTFEQYCSPDCVGDRHRDRDRHSAINRDAGRIADSDAEGDREAQGDHEADA